MLPPRVSEGRVSPSALRNWHLFPRRCCYSPRSPAFCRRKNGVESPSTPKPYQLVPLAIVAQNALTHLPSSALAGYTIAPTHRRPQGAVRECVPRCVCQGHLRHDEQEAPGHRAALPRHLAHLVGLRVRAAALPAQTSYTPACTSSNNAATTRSASRSLPMRLSSPIRRYAAACTISTAPCSVYPADELFKPSYRSWVSCGDNR